MATAAPEIIEEFKIGDETVVLGRPDGLSYGLYRRAFDLDAGHYWAPIPVTYEERNERERLRELRLEAARLANGDVTTARGIFDFLRTDRNPEQPL